MYEAKNHLLIYAEYATPLEHSHMAAHMIISQTEKMNSSINGKTYVSKGILIPSDTPHRIDTIGMPVLVLLYDSTTNVAAHIREVKEISDASCDKIMDAYFRFQRKENRDSYNEFEQCCLNEVGIMESKCMVEEERIASAISYITNHLSEKITCKQAADAVFLSQGRFSHLFKKQVGMTFASYLIYQRIIYAYTELLKGKTITEASLNAGFSSSVHFADVNRRIFGLTASDIVRNLMFLKIE